MIHPIATVTPPKATMSFGPRCGPSTSTIQPWIGVSQVSSAMKIANANWMEAIDQPCVLLIGLTKSVQPYCRLAIIIMQITQNMSLLQRVPSDSLADAAVPTAIVMTIPSTQCSINEPSGRVAKSEAIGNSLLSF